MTNNFDTVYTQLSLLDDHVSGGMAPYITCKKWN